MPATRRTAADDFGKKLSEYLRSKEGKTDAAKLRAFADANDCWDAKYEQLGVGMQRMNVANRARAKVRKGATLTWPHLRKADRNRTRLPTGR